MGMHPFEVQRLTNTANQGGVGVEKKNEIILEYILDQCDTNYICTFLKMASKSLGSPYVRGLCKAQCSWLQVHQAIDI